MQLFIHTLLVVMADSTGKLTGDLNTTLIIIIISMATNRYVPRLNICYMHIHVCIPPTQL